MCLVCIDFAKGKLTIEEARRNIGEMITSEDVDHLIEVATMLEEAENEIRNN